MRVKREYQRSESVAFDVPVCWPKPGGAISRALQTAAITVLAVGLAVALAGDGYLLVRANHLNDDLARTENGTQTQISKLNDATTTLLEQERQRLQDLAQEMKQQVKGVNEARAARK